MSKIKELVELAEKANVAGQGTYEMVYFRLDANPAAILDIAAEMEAMEKELTEQGILLDRVTNKMQKAEAELKRIREAVPDAVVASELRHKVTFFRSHRECWRDGFNMCRNNFLRIIEGNKDE